MTKIYCKENANGKIDFYIVTEGVHYFLFSQKRYKRGRSDYAIHRTMTKLPGYIKFIEKEYGIAVLNQSKRRLQEAA